MDDRRFLLKHNDRENFLSPMRLCSGKMWKSNVKNIFSYNFPRWPVGVKVIPRGTQVTAQSLKTRQQNCPKLDILQNGNPIHVQGFSQTGVHAFLSHKNLSGTPLYESQGSKAPSLLEESMPLQYERTQIWVSGSHIKDSVGSQGPKMTTFWLKPCMFDN